MAFPLGIYFLLFYIFYFTTISAIFEETFCVCAGDAVHIDVARAQERQVAVPHIKLQTGQVSAAFCVETRVGMAQNIANPAAAKAGIIPYFPPAALPVCRTDFSLF